MKKIIFGLALVLSLGLLASCSNTYSVDNNIGWSETSYYKASGTYTYTYTSTDADGKVYDKYTDVYTAGDNFLDCPVEHTVWANDSNISDEWIVNYFPYASYKETVEVKRGVEVTEDNVAEGKNPGQIGIWLNFKLIDGELYHEWGGVTQKLDSENVSFDDDEIIIKMTDKYEPQKEGSLDVAKTATFDLVLTRVEE